MVGDTQAIRRSQYRTPYALRNEMKAHVKKMLDNCAIREKVIPLGLPQLFQYQRRARMGNQNLGFVWIFELLIL